MNGRHRQMRGAFLAAAALLFTVLPVGADTVSAGSRQCPTSLLRDLGLRAHATPQTEGLRDSFFVISRPHRPRAGRYCLVDVWTVPDVGWSAHRFVALVDVRTRSIVSYTDVMIQPAAAQHDWTPGDLRGIELDSSAHQEIVVMLCYGSGPLLAPVRGLVRRLTGQSMPDCG